MYRTSDTFAANEIDVRSLLPDERHQKALQLATELTVGDSFVLVNDKDPGRLRLQLEAEYRHQFFWNYLEHGPDIWRVHIGRLQSAW